LQIAFFGLTISSSWGNGHATPYRALLRALHLLGVRVVFYEQDVPYYARHRDFIACNYCEFVLYGGWKSLRQKALRRARECDVLVTASYLPEGALISQELLSVEGPLHVFYDLDTPITLEALATGGAEYLHRGLIPQFDLYLSFTGGSILHRLGSEFGARCARPLYGCVDPDVYVRTAHDQRFSSQLSFMGTHAPDREQKLRELFLAPAERCPQDSYLLAGSMYPHDWNWPENIRRLEHLSPADHPAFYSSSRATLNLTRAEMADSGYCPSGRFFEAAACGTPLLTDEWEGLDDFFDPEEELFSVRTTQDVLQALQSSDAELGRRAVRARQRTLDEHTGGQRARQFLRFCEEAWQLKHSTLEAVA